MLFCYNLIEQIDYVLLAGLDWTETLKGNET